MQEFLLAYAGEIFFTWRNEQNRGNKVITHLQLSLMQININFNQFKKLLLLFRRKKKITAHQTLYKGIVSPTHIASAC